MNNPALPFNFKKENISSIFFDFDGVLVDSVPLKLKAYQEIFRPYGEDVVLEITNFHLANGGIDRYKKIQHVLQKFSLPVSHVNILADQFAGLVKEKVIQANPIEPMINLAIDLHSQIPIFIVSGTPEIELIEIVKARKWDSYFREIKGSPMTKPMIINTLLENYKLENSKCVFIGDATTDFLSARECGLFFLGVPY
jgi:phosphoglycolate phosphatase-like HAD superfamily hydrolase